MHEQHTRRTHIRLLRTKRLELLFLCVCAFPKASKIGFACKICCSSSPSLPLPPDMAALFLNDVLRGSPVDGIMGLKEGEPETMDGDRECIGEEV
jgi:hypothetical protein